MRRLLLVLILFASLSAARAAPDSIFVQRSCTAQEAQRIAPDRSGYCAGGYWVSGIVDNATYWRQPPTHFVTRVLYQNEGVLEATAALKGYDTSGVRGLIALASPATAGWTMNVRFESMPEMDWMLVLQADSAAQWDMFPHIIYNDSGAETDYALALLTGNTIWRDPVTGDRFMDMEVCVSMQPASDCAGVPVRLKQWFKTFARLQGR